MSNYPAWRYHANKPAVVIDSEEADKALGEGWYNNPMLDKAPGYEAPKPEPKPAVASIPRLKNFPPKLP